MNLDASNNLNSYILDDENVSQFFHTHIKSTYFDTDSFVDTFKNSTEPLILSVNIQSLNSKYFALKSYIKSLTEANLPIDLIILQETWDIKKTSQLAIPGFQNIVYRVRERGRGGGVGIYVRNGLNFKERHDLELYKLNTFENVVLEVCYPSKSYIISNIYRSPNPPPQVSISDHMDNFLDSIDSHLSQLSELNCQSYVFLDANINLLRLRDNQIASSYLDAILTNGFIQIISKATRIQNNKASLIDHILANSNLQKYNAGTIIDDLSDHFMNFLQLSNIKNRKNGRKRDFAAYDKRNKYKQLTECS